MRLHNFSDDSVKKAYAAHELGFDTIGKEYIPLTQNTGLKKVFMRNVKNKVYLNDKWFPELEKDEEVAVTYIMHHKEINKLYEKGGPYHHEGIIGPEP